MRWIKVHNFRVTPEGNVAMIITATGKPLVLSAVQIKHRQGNLIWVEDWLYKKLDRYVIPTQERPAASNRKGNGAENRPGRSLQAEPAETEEPWRENGGDLTPTSAERI